MTAKPKLEGVSEQYDEKGHSLLKGEMPEFRCLHMRPHGGWIFSGIC